MRNLILPVLVAAAFAGAAAPAPAQSVSSVVVTYEDLDLTSPEGRQQLASRIALAVDKVCAPLPDRLSVADTQDWAACRKDAAAKAKKHASVAISAAGTRQVASAD